MSALTVRSAFAARAAILTLSIGSLVLVFQPVSKILFGIGCVTVFVSAIVFNLMPFLQAGQSYRAIMRVGLIILAVLGVLVLVATLSAWGYVLYLQSS